MKKFLVFFLITLSFAGCKEQEPVIDPVILLSDGATEMTVPAEGGMVSVKYSVTSPVEGAQVSATSSEAWIDGFAYDTEGVITFEVSENDQAVARTSVLTVNYIYADGEVQARMDIVQEAGSPYDYRNDLPMCTGVYYGKDIDAYRFRTVISELPLDEGGHPQSHSTYYLFNLYSPAPEDQSDPRPAAGTYTLADDGSWATGEMTFSHDGSKCCYEAHDGEYINSSFESGSSLTISYEGDNMVIKCSLSDNLGKTHRVTYEGPCDYGVYYEGPLAEDLEVVSDTAFISYQSGDNVVMQVSIRLADEQRLLSSEALLGSLLDLRLNLPFDRDLNVPSGVYPLSEGREVNTTYYAGCEYCPDYITYYTDAAERGSVTVSGDAGNITVTGDFYTSGGRRFKVTHTGPLGIARRPEPFSTLTGDSTMSFGKVEATAEFRGDTYGTGGGNWILFINPEPGSGSDGLMVDFVVPGTGFSDGIPSGTYTVATKSYPAPGECMPGYISREGFMGTIYFGGVDDSGAVSKYAPAISGTMLLTDNGDGTCHIVMKDCIDDKGNKWGGEWEGPVSLSDMSSMSSSAGSKDIVLNPGRYAFRHQPNTEALLSGKLLCPPRQENENHFRTLLTE